MPSDSVVIKGRITEGLKESCLFTHIPWVLVQFITRLDIDPYPGTLNLEITEAEDLAKLKAIKKRKGIEITPGAPGFCPAKCFHVLIDKRIKGAAIFPQVPGYPESKLEIIASEKIMDSLSLKVGDLLSIEILKTR